MSPYQLFRNILLIIVSLLNASAFADSRPNILILLADDMGYEDVGCFNGPATTPHIDQLASEGLRFTDFYAGAPNCSPSRAALLTGRISSRTGIFNYIPPAHGMHLPADEITIAQLLKNSGYATGLFGKWHLSHTEVKSTQPKPASYGFDYTYCTRNNAEPSHKDPDNFYRNGKALGKQTGYSSQLVATECIDWLNKRGEEAPPFFAYVAFHEPHKKLAAPPELIAAYETMSKQDALYYATITNLDQAVGRILKNLEALNLSENTFVLFASDNGSWREGSQGPLRGKKSDIWDGGIRVPGIIRWPGKISAGSTTNEPAGVVDMLPTLCAIAGIDAPTDRVIDGSDISPLFRSEPLQRNTPLFWYFYRADPQVALRDGDWILVGHIDDPEKKRSHWLTAEDIPFIKTTKPTEFRLYNLRVDIGQQEDKADAEPDRLAMMKATMRLLHQSVVSESDDWTETIKDYERPKNN